MESSPRSEVSSEECSHQTTTSEGSDVEDSNAEESPSGSVVEPVAKQKSRCSSEEEEGQQTRKKKRKRKKGSKLYIQHKPSKEDAEERVPTGEAYSPTDPNNKGKEKEETKEDQVLHIFEIVSYLLISPCVKAP